MPTTRCATYPPPYPPSPAPDRAESAVPTTTLAGRSTTTTTTTEADPGQAATSTPADPPTTTAARPRQPGSPAASTLATNVDQRDHFDAPYRPCPGPPPCAKETAVWCRARGGHKVATVNFDRHLRISTATYLGDTGHSKQIVRPIGHRKCLVGRHIPERCDCAGRRPDGMPRSTAARQRTAVYRRALAPEAHQHAAADTGARLAARSLDRCSGVDVTSLGGHGPAGRTMRSCSFVCGVRPRRSLRRRRSRAREAQRRRTSG
jgi:hypothetical protein